MDKVLPLVCKIMEGAKKTIVFNENNPWLQVYFYIIIGGFVFIAWVFTIRLKIKFEMLNQCLIQLTGNFSESISTIKTYFKYLIGKYYK